MKLVVATTNTHKLSEIRSILAGLPITVDSLADYPAIEEPEETGRTFVDNARLKVLHYARHLRAVTVADGCLAATVDLVTTAIDDQRSQFSVERGSLAAALGAASAPQPVLPRDGGVGVVELDAERVGGLAVVLEVIDATTGRGPCGQFQFESFALSRLTFTRHLPWQWSWPSGHTAPWKYTYVPWPPWTVRQAPSVGAGSAGGCR